jgi:hypothetical protein
MEGKVFDANLPRSLAFGGWGSLLVLPCTEDESELHLYKVVSDSEVDKPTSFSNRILVFKKT